MLLITTQLVHLWENWNYKIIYFITELMKFHLILLRTFTLLSIVCMKTVISFIREYCAFAWWSEWLVDILLEVVEGQYLFIFDLFSICCYFSRYIESQVRRTGKAIMNIERCQYVVIFEEMKICIGIHICLKDLIQGLKFTLFER